MATTRRRARRSTWSEQTWHGRQERVRANSSVRSTTSTLEDGGRDRADATETDRLLEFDPDERSTRSGSFGASEDDDGDEDGDEDEEVSDSEDGSDDDSEDDDEDDLIDIPKPGHATLRSRTSRASLLSLPSTSITRDNSLRASRNYGSMRSLCELLSLLPSKGESRSR